MKPTKRILATILALLITFGQPTAILADSTDQPAASAQPTTSDSSPASTTPTAPASSDSGTSTDPASSSTPATGPANSPSSPAPSTPATGPQGPVGPQTPTGPTQPTGPQGPVGPQTPTGPTQPTGIIPAYAFNDVTHHWDATLQATFTYDATLGRYSSPLYWFDAATGWYHVLQSPSSSILSSGSGALAGGSGSSGWLGGSAGQSNPAAVLAQLLGLSDPAVENTGSDSSNLASVVNTNVAMLQLLTSGLLTNNSSSIAQSGSASVEGNTTGGNATSGPASIVDNLLNLLNAAWSWSNGGLGYFADNIFGDQNGNINLNPTATTTGGGGGLGSCPTNGSGVSSSNTNTGSGSTNTATQSNSCALNVNAQTSGTITNNIGALATSGDATVANNTTGGSATSGDASANINIFNMINSLISAGQSFFGLVNIFGNLNGDILFPQGFLDGATSLSAPSASGTGSNASNTGTGPGSTNNANVTNSTTTDLTNSTSGTFNNNINTAAQSGNAGVEGNTTAGDATTGSATTNNVLANLFNTDVVGSNAVLVLVNVMGHWVGHIMNLPTGGGSMGALLTGDATVSNASNTGTGPGSTNNANVTNSTTTDLTNSTSGTITNNIYAGAQTGDATVANNTTGGNATSGNASVATNVANVLGSVFNLKNWFGVLVINVFGDWNGSLQNASPQAVAVVTGGTGGAGSGAATGSGSNVTGAGGHFPVATVAGVGAASGSTVAPGAGGGNSGSGTTAAHIINAAAHVPSAAIASSVHNTGFLIVLAAITLLLAGGAIGLERKLTHAQRPSR